MTTTEQPDVDQRYHVRIVNTQLEHVERLEELQRIAFPTLSDEELFTAGKYRSHLKYFPEGQFVAILEHAGDAPLVVGATSTMRTNFDFDHIQHTFNEACGDGWITNHDPNGEWLYGIDMMVHPQYRRRKIGSRFYRARQDLAKKLNLRGEIIGGMLPAYERFKRKMPIEKWVQGVVQGKYPARTLAMQLRNGFEFRGILYDHITDPRSNHCAALLVRPNPEYKPPAG